MAFTSQTLATAAAVIGLAFAAAAGLGGRIYKSLADGYRGERDLALERVERLEAEKGDLAGTVEGLQAKVAELQRQIDDLKAKDVSSLFDLVVAHDKRTEDAARAARLAEQAILDGLTNVVTALRAIAAPPA